MTWQNRLRRKQRRADKRAYKQRKILDPRESHDDFVDAMVFSLMNAMPEVVLRSETARQIEHEGTGRWQLC